MRMRTDSLVVLILALAGANEPIAAMPPNDDCVNAIPISGEGVFFFDSTGGTAVDPPPTSCSHYYAFLGPEFAADVWFCWTAECTGDVTVDTCGQTTVDTRLAVYDECVCPPDVLEGCDDDGCLYQSRVSFIAVSGQSYLIRIGTQPGLSGGAGTFRIKCEPSPEPPDPLNWSCPSPAQPQPSEAMETCNARDRWDAQNSTRTKFIVADEFVPDTDGNITGVCWWGTYLRDGEECSRNLVDFFEVTYYTDDCGAPGPIIAGPFSQEDVTMEVIGPMETYESFPNGAFEYQYSTRHDPVSLRGDEVYWISITNSYYNNCAWFWENALGSDGHAIQIDDRLDAIATVRADLAFCFRLVERNGPVCFAPPDNDDCVDTVPLTIDGASFDTSGATTDGPVNDLSNQPYPPQCYFGLSDEQVHKDIWYDVVAPCTSGLRLGLCDSSFDTKIAVYKGSECPTTNAAIACNDDACGGEFARQSELRLDVCGGAAYKVRIGGFNGDWGTGVLTLAFGPRLQTSLEDFAAFARCFTGPCENGPCNFSNEPCCSFQDFDADSDIDLDDYTLFHAVLLGP